jgi:hypothetical protein
MIQTKYFCPIHQTSISTTDPNFASDKMWIKRARSFMETHKNCSETIKKQLEEYNAYKNGKRH